MAAPQESALASAAEYLYRHQDYSQSLQLWNRLLKSQPDDLQVVSRVAELRFWLEGREGLRQFLWSYFERPLLPGTGSGARLERKGAELQSRFLTEEGQSRYHQALVRKASGDLSSALTLLGQSEALEGANLRVLTAKADCQRGLKTWPALRETLVASFQANPLDSRALEAAMEAHVYFRDYGQVLALYKRVPRRFRSTRSRLALGVALLESGGDSAAIGVLKPLSPAAASLSPVLPFALGKALALRSAHAAESIQLLEQFLAGGDDSSNTPSGGWDPYRCAELRDEAKRLVAELKAPRPDRTSASP